jgi:hypothetical protein
LQQRQQTFATAVAAAITHLGAAPFKTCTAAEFGQHAPSNGALTDI